MTFTPRSVEALRRGDTRAFAQLIDQTAPLVRGIVARYHFNLFDQEEAMQEVWLTIFRRREALDPDRSEQLVGWIATVARNKAIDLARMRGRRPETLVDEAPEIAPEPARGDERVEQRELREVIDGFIATLEPQWATFFELYFMRGLAYPEIAARLGVTRLRCRYMRRVLSARVQAHAPLLEALDRAAGEAEANAAQRGSRAS